MTHLEVMFIFTLCGGVLASPIDINYLDSRKGFILEPIGIGISYEKTWTLVTSIQLPEWEPVLNYLEYCDQTLLQVCGFRGEEAEDKCKYWHQIVQREIRDIQEQVGELKGFTQKPRMRRGLVDGIGRVSKFLFGTMDHEDSEQIYKRIQNLEEHDTENLQLISKQVSVIKSNFNALLNPIKTIKQEQYQLRKVVSTFIKEYTDNTSKLDKEVHKTRVQVETSEIMLAVLANVQMTQKSLSHLFTLMNALQLRKLHPLLLRADTLASLYSNISAQENLNPLLKDPSTLNHIMTVDHLLLPKQILVKISIPLGTDRSYNLNKVYRYPVPVGSGKFALLDFKADYVLRDNLTTIAIPLTSENFAQRCTNVQLYEHKPIFLCKEKDPTPITGDAQDPCLEYMVLNKISKKPKCPAQILAYHPQLIIRLEVPNTWLFSFPSEKTLQAHCSGGIHRKGLEGTGILHLASNCAYTLGSWKLPTETAEKYNMSAYTAEETFIPNLVFHQHSIPNITSHMEVLQVDRIQPDRALDTAAQRTNELAAQIHQTETRRIQEHQGYQLIANFGLSSTTVIVLLAIGIYLWVRIRRKQRPSSVRNTEIPITISAPTINKINGLPGLHENPSRRNPPAEEKQEAAPKISRSKPLAVTTETHYERPPLVKAPTPPTNKPGLQSLKSLRIPRHSTH